MGARHFVSVDQARAMSCPLRARQTLSLGVRCNEEQQVAFQPALLKPLHERGIVAKILIDRAGKANQ
jgi:hypothetical protein